MPRAGPDPSSRVRSTSGRYRADRVERRARRDEQRAPICAAKRQAAGTLGNLENADRLSIAIVDPDLIACDEDIAGNIRDDRCAAALVEDCTAELAVWLERHAVGAAIIFAGQEMKRALREGRQLRALLRTTRRAVVAPGLRIARHARERENESRATTGGVVNADLARVRFNNPFHHEQTKSCSAAPTCLLRLSIPGE